jgi:hypothetical protein
MPSVNPGPAVTATPNSEIVLTPVNTLGTTAPPQAANGYRLLGSSRAVNLSGLGDAALIQIVNSSSCAHQWRIGEYCGGLHRTLYRARRNRNRD